MTSIEWKSDLQVGNALIDQDHEGLVAILRSLYEGIEHGATRSERDSNIDELIRATRAHFLREEGLMQEHSFPGTGMHMRMHVQLLDLATELTGRAVGAEAVQPTRELADFLRTWLLDHIRHADSDFAAFLRERGVK